jgi:hypothetical protein
MSLIRIPAINGTLPDKFSNMGGGGLYSSGYEWWKAFNGNIYSFWNPNSFNVTDYLLVTFNDEYLLSSMQLTVYSDGWHDPKTINVWRDENATCMGQSFLFAKITNISHLTFAPSQFDIVNNPLVTKQILLDIDPYGTNQVWLYELAFFGALY